MDIRLIKQEDIDKTKWNSCVHYSPHGNIFGYKWYLDNVAKDWDGLVEGDYESVFPLIWKDQTSGFWRKKERVLHQPEMIRTAGLYSIHVHSEKRIKSFLEQIPKEYQKQKITLGEGTKVPSGMDYQSGQHTNFMLLLQEPYEQLASQYSPVLQQQLERASLAQLLPQNNFKPEKLADFYLQEALGDRKNKEANAHAAQRIMYNALHRGWGFLSAVTNRKQELLAIDFFIISHKRIMSLMPVESAAGAKVGAMAFLYDMLLRSQAERPFLLDFNTHEESKLARSLGATEVPFTSILRG